ncbi:MAG TPA: hypothetical protein VGN28_11525 [Blastococcus sp.]|nr:hypothetical protein [Blastococcus sp.]
MIIGGAVLVAGVGILLVLLLRPQNRAGTSTAATGSTAASSAPATAGASTPGRLPGGARVADRSTGGRARFDGSAQVALSWVQAMADRDFRTAYDLSCAGVRQAAIDAAAAGDPAQALGRSFFQKTLSGRGFAQGSLDSVIYNQEADSDIASFTLRLDSGEEFLLLVYVQGDGTVCDFI